MNRTSTSHPLRIDPIDLPAGGSIGLTFCPGKKQADAFTGKWDRDLPTDIQAIRAWGAAAVVTLIEPHEFTSLGVPDLGEQIEAAGIEWHHLPICDVSVPSEEFAAYWTYSGHRLRKHLTEGRRVVVHCKGGLGRAGTVAAKLLVELGHDPADAIRIVRAARPGAIEVAGQERYVLQSRPDDQEEDFTDRVLGCLLGGAVGDGLGYEVEFQHLPAILAQFGDQGIRQPEFHGGKLVVSDDTQMTLFTLEGLLRSIDARGRFLPKQAIEEIRRAYLDWFVTQDAFLASWTPVGRLHQEDVLRHRRAPGNTCLSALAAGGHGRTDNPINDSKGCGGVMRVAPLGLVRSWAPATSFMVAAEAAAVTHTHPSGYLSAAAMAAIIRMLVDGLDLPEAVDEAVALLGNAVAADETMDALREAKALWRDGHDNHLAVIGRLGGGWVGEEALAIGVYAALVGNSFADVLAIAANHSGDSDSTASIAGQIYGAWKGLADLPHPWVRRLDVLEPLLSLTREFLQAPIVGEQDLDEG